MAFRRGAAGAVLSALVLLVGCGEQGRGFEVPESLCGTRMPAGTLDPLLPDEGDSADVSLKRDDKRARTCQVGVGDRMVLTASVSGVPEYYDPMSKDGGAATLRDPRRMPELPFAGAGATGSGGDAVTTVRCGGSGPAYLYLDLSVRAESAKEADDRQLRADLREFSVTYLKDAMKREGCAR